MKKVSIIIPVYNVEKYIKKCLESVVCQSYQNIEIIIVNDGSTDKSGDICKAFAQEYSNVIYISQKNKGQSSARNVGLKCATGELICFLDSDDYVEKSFVSEMAKYLYEYKADIVQCGVWEIFPDNKTVSSNIKDTEIISNYEAIDKMIRWGMDDLVIRPAVWNKMFKREVIHNLFFWEGKISEDYYFTFEALKRSKRICLMKENLYYHIYTNQNSTTRSAFNIKRLDLLQAYDYILDNLPAKVDKNTVLFAYLNHINHFFYEIYALRSCESRKIIVQLRQKEKSILSELNIRRSHFSIIFRALTIVYTPNLYIHLMSIVKGVRNGK